MNLSKYARLYLNFILYFNHYRKMQKLLRGKDFDKVEKVEEFQFRQIKKLLIYAYQNVPYYKQLFDSINFQPDDFKAINDIKRIPFLTKEIIAANKDELKSSAIPEQHIKRVQTGGTTGMPTEFLLDRRYASLSEMVFLRHMWKRVGYRPGARCVILREDTVEKIIVGKKYWKRNILTNWLVMSAFHLNADTFLLYYNKIRSYKPEFILAFPSNAILIARFIKENNLEAIPSLKAVICASENLYEWQREYMSDVFGVRIYSYYGHSEKCILASETADADGFEFYPQYGFVELVNEQGEDCSVEDESGEIIATGFRNFVAPFIRYKTDDIGVFTAKRSPEYPHWFNIKKIEGRAQDFLIDWDNVPKTYMHIDRPFWNIRDKVYAYQYIQDEPGKVQLNIHSKEDLSENEIEEIKKIFHRTYLKFELTIQEVDEIPRSKGGKFRYLIQNIKLNGDAHNQGKSQYRK